MKHTRKLSILAALVVTLVSGVSSAQTLITNPGIIGNFLDMSSYFWSAEFLASEVYADQNDDVIIRGGKLPSAYPGNNTSCANSDVISIKGGGSAVVSVGVASMLSGKKLRCYVLGCDGAMVKASGCKLVH